MFVCSRSFYLLLNEKGVSYPSISAVSKQDFQGKEFAGFAVIIWFWLTKG